MFARFPKLQFCLSWSSEDVHLCALRFSLRKSPGRQPCFVQTEFFAEAKEATVRHSVMRACFCVSRVYAVFCRVDACMYTRRYYIQAFPPLSRPFKVRLWVCWVSSVCSFPKTPVLPFLEFRRRAFVCTAFFVAQVARTPALLCSDRILC